MKMCAVDVCDRKYFSKDLCKPHYYRKRRTGVAEGRIKSIRKHTSIAEALQNYSLVGECWIWGGTFRKDGYGAFDFEKVTYGAHRASYEYHNKVTIPNQLLIRHRCHTRACINPAHLRIGTHADNMNDMVISGRNHTKLSKDDVLGIRSDREVLGLTNTELGVKYGVTKWTISGIINRRSWVHV